MSGRDAIFWLIVVACLFLIASFLTGLIFGLFPVVWR